MTRATQPWPLHGRAEFKTSRGRDGYCRRRGLTAAALPSGSSCDCGCPSFWLDPHKSLPPAEVLERVPVGATGRDPGGNLVGVILFVDGGYMSQLEVFSHEGVSAFAGIPDPADLEIDHWSEPDEHGTQYLLNPPEDVE